ncbi:MAG: transcription antitermination factor NusB [Mariprofundaceae bacterium]
MIDWCIAYFVDISPVKVNIFRFVRKYPPKFIQLVLLAGACQIRHLCVPTFSAVEEMVVVAKLSPRHFASGMVNAVLCRHSHHGPE